MFRVRTTFRPSGGRVAPERVSHHRGHLVAGLDDAAPYVDAGEQYAAEYEEHHQRDDRRPVRVRELEHQAEEQGAGPARAALGRLVEAEVLGLAATGDQLAVQRARQR